MQEDQQYLVPDYYPSFACKQGACRAACCEGWPISFTMQDYFRLLGVPCSPQLRRKLDAAMHLCDHPTQEAYAQISPAWDGHCPMHLADGRCAMHAELGEDMLSAVCRLYPRGVRSGDIPECSCANSCEATLELLLERPDPLQFISSPLPLTPPSTAPRLHFFHTGGREKEIRLWLIRLLQEGSAPLSLRLLRLGDAMHQLDQALTARDDAHLGALLTGGFTIPLPAQALPDAAARDAALDAARQMLSLLDERSQSLHDRGEAALAWFGQGEAAHARYDEASQAFAALLPGWEGWLSRILANHMYFTQFPFQDRPVPIMDEYLALCAVYALLRLLCIGCTAEHPTTDTAVDACAAAFRLVEHTAFDQYAANLLHRLGFNSRELLWPLLCL